jgi:zinc transport system substrate-binding protein
MRVIKGFALLLLVVSLLLAPSACTKKDPEAPGSGKIVVVTTLFPLYDFARNVAGDKASVSLLLPPGTEPHSFEPRPKDIARINNADLFIYTGPFMEPWAGRVLNGIDRSHTIAVDASSGITLQAPKSAGHDHGHGDKDHNSGQHRYDPHIWLDFVNAQKMVDTIAQALSRKDPAHATLFSENAAAYKAKLADLDRRYKERLDRCATKAFVHGGHYAFGYLANRYGLVYISAYEGSPNAEPTPRRLAYLKGAIQKNDLKSLFYEELITPRIAETLSRETGASLLKLHGAHNISRDDLERGVTFISLMEENLNNLGAGLNCPPLSP